MDRIESASVIAVVTVDSVTDAIPLAQSLMAGGVSAIELTLRSDFALQAMAKIAREVPEVLLGAGTVLTPQQVRQAHDAGAAFAVSPGCNPTVIEAARDAKLP